MGLRLLMLFDVHSGEMCLLIIQLFVKWLSEPSPLCYSISAGWIKRQRLKKPGHSLSLCLCSCILLSRIRGCFIIVVLQSEDSGRIWGLFHSSRSIMFSRQGHSEEGCFIARIWCVCLSSTSRSARSVCSWETFSLNSFSSFLLDSTSSPFSLSSLSRCSFSRSMIRS